MLKFFPSVTLSSRQDAVARMPLVSVTVSECPWT